MLTEWTISNFKSFSGSTRLPLAPITILAGANSSGKSSIIQSILLIKQTLQYAPSTRPIGLNGPLLKLGRFDDIKNAKTEAEDISLGWVIEDLSSYRSMAAGPSNRFLYFSGDDKLKRATIHLSFSTSRSEVKSNTRLTPTPELSQLQPTLNALTLKTELADGKVDRTASLSLTRQAVDPSKHDPSLGPHAYEFPYAVKRLDQDTRNNITGGRPETSIVGADLSHFFPFRFGYFFNQKKYFSQRVAEYIVTPNSPRYTGSEISEYPLPPDVVNLILDYIEAAISSDEQIVAANRPAARHYDVNTMLSQLRNRAITAKDFVRQLDFILSRQNPRMRQPVRNALVEKLDELQQALLEHATSLSERGFEFGVSYDIAATAEFTQNFFQSSIHYLGPLRDEPRPIYPLEALINPKDVGYRGEHTAAVLDLHRGTLVECFRSSDAGMLIGAEPVTAPLLQAVQDWLSYLGVAEAVTTTDLGKMGHQLQVSVDKNTKTHDLTNVGVGVSQLLPIVVMSLLANSPCLLIFEQPELHLHPKVQARLADFFFSLSLLGKQCLLETHSEYLVERFRLRIAQAPEDTLSERVKIYFTQKVDDQTVCREIRLTKYGAIVDWPDDFFDQSEAETEAILKAAQLKRKKEGVAPTAGEGSFK